MARREHGRKPFVGLHDSEISRVLLATGGEGACGGRRVYGDQGIVAISIPIFSLSSMLITGTINFRLDRGNDAVGSKARMEHDTNTTAG